MDARTMKPRHGSGSRPGVTTAIGWALAVVVSASVGAPVRAADTLEPWAAGDSDVESYIGVSGLGHGSPPGPLVSEVVVGRGLTDRVSGYVGSTLATPVGSVSPESGLYAGIFGALLDSDHVDLDLLLDVTVHGPGLGHVTLLPMLQVNLDLLPDLALLGLYADVALPATTHAIRHHDGRLAPALAIPPRHDRPFLSRPTEYQGLATAAGLPHLGVLSLLASAKVGAYWMVRPGHQLLAELDLAAPLHCSEGCRPLDVGGLTLGYNVEVSETMESINQVTLDVPQEGERPTAAVTTGIILSLPSSTW